MLAPATLGQQRASDEADDALERFLAQRQFTALQIRHLEQRLASSDTPEARNEMARRLVEAYAAMVEQTTDHAERQRWTERSRAIIDQTPGEDADDLRLSLAQSRFRMLEQSVRAWRLRLDPPRSARDAENQPIGIGRIEVELIDLAAEMAQVADRANNRSRALERQRNRALAGELIFLEDEIAEANRRRSLGHYLAGWAAYHTAEIQASRSRQEITLPDGQPSGSATQKAVQAQAHFAWLLGGEEGQAPSIDRLSDTLLGFEHVARAALGYALAESIRGIYEPARIRSALDWLNAIDGSERVPMEIRRQLTTARVLVFVRGRNWADLNTLLADSITDDAEVMPAALARLLVVLTADTQHERASDQPIIEQIRAAAIAALITGGHLNQVLDLASRYGLANRGPGDTSFIVLYASALQNYQSMRDMLEARGQSDAAPTPDRDAAELALRAAQDIRDALDAPDADRHHGIRGQANLLLGIASFHAANAEPARLAAYLRTGEPLRASAEAFARAADQLTDRDQAAYALWMAIRAIDAHQSRSGSASAEARQRRDEIVLAFIARFPNDDRAAALRLQNAQREGTSTEAALQELLAVPPTSSLHDAARRRAADLAFQLHRAAEPADRPRHAARFLELAEPIFNIDRQLARGGDASAAVAAVAAVAQARRMLEVLLDRSDVPTGPSARQAERILGALRELSESSAIADAVDPAGVRIELLYREAQLALARNDDATAETIADQLVELGPESAIRAARLFYLHFNRQWNALRRSAEAPDAARIEVARRLIQHAGALAESLQREGTTMGSATLVTVLFTRAEAQADLARLTGEPDLLADARTTLGRLLEAHPRDQRLLRTVASLAIEADDFGVAIDAYRRLLPAMEPGTDDWFEIRTLLIEALAEADPARARLVLDQHAAIYPEFGPSPWGERLRVLHRELPARPAKSEGGP